MAATGYVKSLVFLPTSSPAPLPGNDKSATFKSACRSDTAARDCCEAFLDTSGLAVTDNIPERQPLDLLETFGRLDLLVACDWFELLTDASVVISGSFIFISYLCLSQNICTEYSRHCFRIALVARKMVMEIKMNEDAR